MVAPITAFNRSFGSSEGLFSKVQNGFKQAKPVNQPLAYRSSIRNCVYESRLNFHPGDSNIFGTWICPNDQSGYQSLINDCASALRGQVSDSAGWGENLGQYSQTIGMMSGRIRQLWDFTRAIRRFRFVEAAEALGYARPPKGVSRVKPWANNWLEFSFGWKPLIQDIYSTVDILQNPIKAVRLRRTVYGNVQETRITGNPSIGSTQNLSGRDFCRMGCTVTVSNPNLYLANNLGLANPAVVAWELIPFSFVVDWFVSVEQFLNSGSAWWGLQVTQPWTTFGRIFSYGIASHNVFDSPSSWSSATFGTYVQRRASIVESAIVVRPWKLPGWQRAANAAALLVQSLR